MSALKSGVRLPDYEPRGSRSGRSQQLWIARNAASSNIADYNAFVQNVAKGGHSAISDSCGNLFKVVGSTSSVDARDNTGTTSEPLGFHYLQWEGVRSAETSRSPLRSALPLTRFT